MVDSGGYFGFVVGGLIYLCASVRSPIPSYYFILAPELESEQRGETRPQVIRHKTNGQLNEGENEHSENTWLLKIFHKEHGEMLGSVIFGLLELLISAPVCLPSPAFQTNEYFAKLYWIMNSIKMSEIIQIQKLNGWWEEINFHFMKYFPIWNNITYGMSSFSAVHNTLTEGGMRQLSLVDIAIFIQTDLWRYLCDCDPLGAFSRQRWARISNERGMSPAVKLNIPTFQENLQFWPQTW